MANNLWDSRRAAFRAALKEARTKSGFTQEELAEVLGKPQSFVSKYENGERKLEFIEVCDICDALNLKLTTFNRLYQSKLKNGTRTTT